MRAVVGSSAGIVLAALLLWSLAERAAGEAPGDVAFRREGGTAGLASAVFPHWVHRIRFRCYACHDALFPMRPEARTRSGEALHETSGCGACHDGKQAWSISLDTCGRCHVGR